MTDKESTYTLLQLNREVKLTVENNFQRPIWVVAEINKLNHHRASGHCYLELVQKSNQTDAIVASARGTLWASMYGQIKSYFETATGVNFTEGINVLLKVSVEFHELYGFSLNIRDIDPAYTVGDIAKRRKEIIDRLYKENVINMNKELEVVSPLRRIAVISSETAAGYQDFLNHINNNPYGYKFDIELFSANMQGAGTEASMKNAFDEIFENVRSFDIVAIIRGGGSKTDLAAFDNYNIAFHITQFPLPVITGIGHERDDTVVDIVAHTKFKTPTAVADFIVENNLFFENEVIRLGDDIIERVRDIFYVNNLILTQLSLKLSKLRKKISVKIEDCNEYAYKLRNYINRYINLQFSILDVIRHKNSIYSKEYLKSGDRQLEQMSLRIKDQTKADINKKMQSLKKFEDHIRLMDPKNVLKRGYSITKHNNKIVDDAHKIPINSEIETVFYKNSLISKVVRKK